MGQGSSVEDFIPHSIDNIQDELVRHFRNFSEITSVSYEEFVRRLGELNILSKKCLDKNGKQLLFAIQKGTDSTILWKGTVRVLCVKIDPKTNSVESHRFISLSEFFRIFNTIKEHMNCIAESEKAAASDNAGTSTVKIIQSTEDDFVTMSMLIERISHDSIDKTSECCICLERSPEVILPCTHSYCLPCIERWNVNNKTCPICREKLETTDDTWIISEAPNAAEISAEISATLHGLSIVSTKRNSKS